MKFFNGLTLDPPFFKRGKEKGKGFVVSVIILLVLQ